MSQSVLSAAHGGDLWSPRIASMTEDMTGFLKRDAVCNLTSGEEHRLRVLAAEVTASGVETIA